MSHFMFLHIICAYIIHKKGWHRVKIPCASHMSCTICSRLPDGRSCGLQLRYSTAAAVNDCPNGALRSFSFAITASAASPERSVG